MRPESSGKRRERNRENEYGVCCCCFEERVRIRERFLEVRNIFRFMASMSRFFTKKPRVFFRRFFSSRQTGGRRFLDKPLSLVVMPRRERVGGREGPVLPANARTLSSRSSRTAWVCRLAEVARFVQYTPSIWSASRLERRVNRYKNQDHPSGPASAFSVSRGRVFSVLRSALEQRAGPPHPSSEKEWALGSSSALPTPAPDSPPRASGTLARAWQQRVPSPQTAP